MAGVELATAYVSLVVEGSKVAPGVRDSLGAADGEATRAGERAGRSFTSKFGSALKIGATLGAAFAVTKGVQFLGDAIEEAREASVVTARTANVIKSMGNVAGVTAKDVADLAGALSNKAGIDDEAIQSGQNLLLTFGNLRNEVGKGNDIFDQTSALMVDMSVAMDQDMKSSAVQLGKALNDPIKGITALSRVGVSFTEQQKEQIKQAVEQNRTLDAQKIILGEVKRQFGGAAEAMATPAEKAEVAWGNLKEQIGEKLLPTVNRVLDWFSEKGVPAVSRFVDEFGKGRGTAGDIRDALERAKDTAVQFFDEFKSSKGFGGDVRDVMEDVRDAVKAAAGFAQDLVGWFNDMPSWAKKAIIAGGVGAALLPKIPGGSPLSKGLGSALGKAVGGGVQKVFETNPAALGGGPGGGPPGKSKPGIIPAAGGAATAVTIASIIAGIGTAGIFKLQDKVAPKAADQGIVGTPNSGVGLKFDDLDSLNDDIDLTNVKIRTITESLQRIAEGRGWFNSVTDGLLDVRVESAAALDHLVGVGGEVDNVDKKKPKVPFEFPNLDRGFKDTEGLIGKIDVTDRKKPSVPFQFPGLEPGIKDTGKLGGDVDRVGKKKPNVPWSFPNLLNGVRDTLGLGNRVDDVGRKKPSVGFTFPNLAPGIANVGDLNRGIDNLPSRKDITITTYYNSVGRRPTNNPDASGLASGGPVLAGRMYEVNEVGTELFVPNINGRVVPANQRALVGTGGSDSAASRSMTEADLRRLTELLAPPLERALFNGAAERQSRLAAARRT